MDDNVSEQPTLLVSIALYRPGRIVNKLSFVAPGINTPFSIHLNVGESGETIRMVSITLLHK